MTIRRLPETLVNRIAAGEDEVEEADLDLPADSIRLNLTGSAGQGLGAFLTAGHCVGASLQTLQFNVPPSDANGTINHPGTEDQYPIEALANIESSTGFGDDWGVFNAFANSNGELASKRQGAFYRMSRDSNPATIRITGYGVDGPPPNFGNPPPRNADSQTEQTDAGPSAGETVSS
ncbi:MAG: hypothetical protein IH805_03655, partial [Proteobacteria bacterium]|nr:hypothetical protein [Pseudomonadota bacterium]